VEKFTYAFDRDLKISLKYRGCEKVHGFDSIFEFRRLNVFLLLVPIAAICHESETNVCFPRTL